MFRQRRRRPLSLAASSPCRPSEPNRVFWRNDDDFPDNDSGPDLAVSSPGMARSRDSWRHHPIRASSLPVARVAADRPGLMTDRVAARICRVGPRMIGLWIETGAWPLPHAVGATTLYFRASDVECWLRTGTWPAGVRFRSRGSANQGRQSNAEFAPLSDAVTRYLHAPSVHLDEGPRE